MTTFDSGRRMTTVGQPATSTRQWNRMPLQSATSTGVCYCEPIDGSARSAIRTDSAVVHHPGTDPKYEAYWLRNMVWCMTLSLGTAAERPTVQSPNHILPLRSAELGWPVQNSPEKLATRRQPAAPISRSHTEDNGPVLEHKDAQKLWAKACSLDFF